MWRSMSPAMILVLTLAVNSAAAAPRIGELEVREGNGGLPCFSISQAEEQRGGAPNFDAITVSDGKAVLWTMAMPKQRTFPVTFRMCIPYAGRLPVLPQMPAAALQAGKAYDVYVATRKPGAAPQGYRGRFCMVKQAQGLMKVRSLGAKGGCQVL
ncbi:MAG: hypothetical protein V4633_19210 [Pseudomonadota bacterium]